MKRTPLQRKTPLRRSSNVPRKTPPKRFWGDARYKLDREGVCRNCGTQNGLECAHTIAREHDEIRSYDRSGTPSLYVHPDSIIPLCNFTANDCHGRYDRHEIDILHLLSLDEQLDAVKRAGGLELARIRLCPTAYQEAA